MAGGSRKRKSVCLVNEICFCCRICGLSAPALFIFLQKPLFQNQVQATLVVLASRGRSRSSTSPQRKEARSDATSVIVYLYPQLEFRIYIFSLFFFFWGCSRTALTLDTPAVTRYPAQLPVEATVTVINGTKWV